MLQEILQRCGIGKSVILVYLDIVKTQLKKVFLVRPSNINVRGGFRGRAPRPHPYIFCNYFLFRNHLQAGDVSINLASWKYLRVSPINDISVAKNRSQSPKF